MGDLLGSDAPLLWPQKQVFSGHEMENPEVVQGGPQDTMFINGVMGTHVSRVKWAQWNRISWGRL